MNAQLYQGPRLCVECGRRAELLLRVGCATSPVCRACVEQLVARIVETVPESFALPENHQGRSDR